MLGCAVGSGGSAVRVGHAELLQLAREVFLPQPKSLAASWRWPWVRFSAARMRPFELRWASSRSAVCRHRPRVCPHCKGPRPVGIDGSVRHGRREFGGRSSMRTSRPGASTASLRQRLTSSRTLPGSCMWRAWRWFRPQRLSAPPRAPGLRSADSARANPVCPPRARAAAAAQCG